MHQESSRLGAAAVKKTQQSVKKNPLSLAGDTNPETTWLGKGEDYRTPAPALGDPGRQPGGSSTHAEPSGVCRSSPGKEGREEHVRPGNSTNKAWKGQRVGDRAEWEVRAQGDL